MLTYRCLVVLVYDWLLCLGEEVRYVWNSGSGLTGTSLVYASSRYMLLIQTFLAMLTNYPMSDLVRTLAVTLLISRGAHRCARRGNGSPTEHERTSTYARLDMIAVGQWDGPRPQLGL